MDRRYLILGGSGGIGSSLCRLLTDAGAEVVIAGRSESKVRELAEELQCRSHVVDGRDLNAVEDLAISLSREDVGLHGLVNCVGSIHLKPAHLTKSEEWQEVVSTNLTSAFATVRAAGKTLRKQGGSVVLVSSAAARSGIPNHEAIAAAKGGVIGLTLSAAATYAGARIRVNAVAPGLVETPLTERITGRPASAEASRKMHALGRLGRPEDVASLIFWLLKPENDWMTGQVIGIDGGLADLRVS